MIPRVLSTSLLFTGGVLVCALGACTTTTTTTPEPAPEKQVIPTNPTSSAQDAQPAVEVLPVTTDAGKDATVTKDAGPPPTDVVGSAACDAYCARLKGACKITCMKSDCAIPRGQCAASTKAYLQCEADTGQFYCGSSGFSVVSSCEQDTSVCD